MSAVIKNVFEPFRIALYVCASKEIDRPLKRLSLSRPSKLKITMADLGIENEWCTQYKTYAKIDELKGQVVEFPQNLVVHMHHSHTSKSATASSLKVKI